MRYELLQQPYFENECECQIFFVSEIVVKKT